MRDLAGVETFFLAEPGQRIRHHGDALVRRNAERQQLSAANGPALAALRPRIWMLPREVTSMMPLPCRRAAAQRLANAASEIVAPDGMSRARSPSPVAIGADKARTGAAAHRRLDALNGR